MKKKKDADPVDHQRPVLSEGSNEKTTTMMTKKKAKDVAAKVSDDVSNGDTYVVECIICRKVDICETISSDEYVCAKCNDSSSQLGAEGKDASKALPQEYEKFVVLYKNGIKYMQCDQCQFICRPIVSIFDKHYRTHSEGVEEDEKPDISLLNAMESQASASTGDGEHAGSVKEEMDSYECDVCSKVFSSKQRMHRHLKAHKLKRYSCKRCGTAYNTRVELLTHRRTAHPVKQNVSFFCNVCGKNFKTKSGYNHHRANVCVQYKCEICEDVFLVKSVLKDHLKKIHGIEEGSDELEETQSKKETTSTVCPVCGKMVTENALSRHMNLHKEEKPYICDLCGKHFRIKWSLREHIMVEIGMKDYVCEICGKKFVIQAYLNKHMRFHMMCDGKFEGFQCEICGKKYAEEWKVKEHQRNSHKGKNLLRYKCNVCDKKFTRKWLVRSHKRTAHKDQYEEYQCNFCEKKFMEKWIIKLHLQTVHNVKNANEEDTSKAGTGVKGTYNEIQKLLDLEHNKRISCGGSEETAETLKGSDEGPTRKKPYECEVCGKFFATKQGMKNHLYAELNLRKYVCEICGKRYNWWMGLKEHSIMNHGEKEYACALCGKEFPTKKRCKDHLSVHSDDRPYNCKCGNSFKLRRYLAKHQKRCGKTEAKIEIKKECKQQSIDEPKSNNVEPLTRSVTEQPLPETGDSTDTVVVSHDESKTATDSGVSDEFQCFIKLYKNGIMYMQCDLCNFICRPLTALFIKHYKTHSSTSEKCAKLTESVETSVAEDIRKLEGKTHVSYVKENLVNEFRCATCSKLFTERKNYLRHLKIHDKQVYYCRTCDCAFKSRAAFKSHKQRHRRKKTSLFCDLCGKHFRSKDGYKYHRQNKCIEYTCQICKEILKGKPALIDHLKTAHDMDNASSLEYAGLQSSSQTSMCFVCGKIIKNINLQRHMLIHNEEKPFVCDLCGKRFKFKNGIRDHMMVKLGMKDYVCEICGLKFVKRCYLNKHLRFHNMSKEELKRYRCDVCNKKFSEIRLLMVHKSVSHDGEKPFSCDLCGKAYSTKMSLRNHLLREVICVLCDEIFISNELLKQHVFSVHNVKKYREETVKRIEVQSSFVYPCDICGRQFTSEERYKQHILTEVKCEFCGAECADNEELRTHIDMQHNLQEYRKIISLRWKKRIRLGNADSAEYTCNLCGKKLFYKRTLLLHMRMHSGLKPYKCVYCNKAYTSKHSLNVHLVTEMNLRKYVCSYCGKRYNFNSELNVHVKQKHEIRQFSCHVCGKEFGLLKFLKDHSTIHSREKPFNCEKCNLSFRLNKFLLRHNKKYHAEKAVDEIVTIDEV